jgi:GT2 family glycosyltransferase
VRPAIDSFLSSDLRVRLVLIDNSPTDDLRDLAKQTRSDYVFLNGRNAGYGAGHNIAIRRSLENSEYHLVLNPDVSFEPVVLTTLFGFMQTNPHIGLVMPMVLAPDGGKQALHKLLPSPADVLLRRVGGRLGRTLFRRRMERFTLGDVDLSRPRFVPYLSGCFMFMRASALVKSGLFDERFFMYFEDTDLTRRIAEVSHTVYFPGVSIRHGWSRGSYFDNKLLKYHLAATWKYFCKWGWFWDQKRNELNDRALQGADTFAVS